MDEARTVVDSRELGDMSTADAVREALEIFDNLTDADKRARDAYELVHAEAGPYGDYWDGTIDGTFDVLAITGYKRKRAHTDPCVDVYTRTGEFVGTYDTIPDALDEIDMRAAYSDDGHISADDFTICVDGYTVMNGDGTFE